MTFQYRYYRDGKTYSFFYDAEQPDTIRVNDGEVQKRLKVRPSYEWRLAGRKTFVYSIGGAKGLFAWLAERAETGFCTAFIDIVIDDFQTVNKRWIAA